MPLARAALVAAASTPLALPVMMEARGGSDFTYSITRSGSEKRLLPTMATFKMRRLAGGRRVHADGVNVLLEQAAELERLAVIGIGVGPAVTRVQHLAGNRGYAVGDVQPEDRIDVRGRSTSACRPRRGRRPNRCSASTPGRDGG